MNDDGPDTGYGEERALRESMRQALEPIGRELAAVNEEIARLERRIADLRRLRSDAERILRVFDPKPKPKPKRATRPTLLTQAREQRLQAIEAWIREHVDDDQPFGFRDLVRSGLNVPFGSQTDTIRALIDRGVIRLDSVSGDHGRKTYKLIPSA